MVLSASCTVYEQLGITGLAADGIRPGGSALTERALRYCGFAPQSRILDIGCGNGATLAHVQKAHGVQAVGIDPSPVLLDEARRRHGSLTIILGSGETLPFSGGSFDGVVLECTLSLMTSGLTALRECYRVLRPGGRIIVSDLYFRHENAVSPMKSLPVDCCLKGARSRESVPGDLETIGFEVLLWEDHSEVLKEFAVKLIWSYGSIPNFLGLSHALESVQEELRDSIRDCRPGYFLLVGRKNRVCHKEDSPKP
jgi:arsenite methyltransferase